EHVLALERRHERERRGAREVRMCRIESCEVRVRASNLVEDRPRVGEDFATANEARHDLAPFVRHLGRREAVQEALLVEEDRVAAFARSVRFGFVYDDHWTVEGHGLDAPLGRLLWLLARGGAHAASVPDATRPTMVVSVWVARALFGNTPLGQHVESVVLYGIV